MTVSAPPGALPRGFITPEWNGARRVRAFFTTRSDGDGDGDGHDFDVGSSQLSGDDRQGPIGFNRQRLRSLLPADPVWLMQVHGTRVVVLDADNVADAVALPPRADAAVTRLSDVVLTIRTADCLPVLLADRAATVIAVAHAGWRGLAAGVLEAALDAMRVPPDKVDAWIGPGIGPRAFEVGADVVETFCGADPTASASFVPLRDGKWHADLAALAQRRLAAHGVREVSVHGGCTFTEARRYFSFRRDRTAQRMALVAWLAGGQ